MPERYQRVRGAASRGAIEFFIIVAGILAALAVDEWREGQQEQRILDEYLVDLASEVDGNLSSLRIIMEGPLRGKFAGLQEVIRFCQSETIEVEDAEAFLTALARSANDAAPWFVDHRFEALQNSGSLRLVRNPELTNWISAAYESPAVLFGQVAHFRGDYKPFVNQLMPARYQSELNHLAGYAPDEITAPVIEDAQDIDQVLRDIHARRETLLALARNEAAVATGQWYALARIRAQMIGLLEALSALGYESESPFAAEVRRRLGADPGK